MTPLVFILVAVVLAAVAVIAVLNLKRREDRHSFQDPADQGRDRDAREHHHH